MRNVRNIGNNLIMILVIICSFFQLEISCHYESISELAIGLFRYKMLNIITLGVFLFIFVLIFRKAWVGIVVFSLLNFVVSIINYYMIQLHGMPLTVLEVKNATTAMNVFDIRSIKIDMCIWLMIGILIINILLSMLIKRMQIDITTKQRLYIDCIGVIISLVVVYIGYFSPNPVKPKRTITWSWEEAYHQYGFVACSIESTMQLFHIIEKPQNYSISQIESIKLDSLTLEDKSSTEPVDIILILNESFFDLRQVADIQTNIPFMEYYDNLDAIKGYAVVPGIGGGTNSSEYELLTSNSLQLMKASCIL